MAEAPVLPFQRNAEHLQAWRYAGRGSHSHGQQAHHLTPSIASGVQSECQGQSALFRMSLPSAF